jgi:iron complex outermembrane recepter protein
MRNFEISRQVVVTTLLCQLCNVGFAQTQPAPAGSNEIQEIIVTAEKRTENAQKTPVAVTAVNGDTLEKLQITDSRGLEEVVPSASIRPEGAVSQTFIRGVGNNVDQIYTDPGVAYNVNGIYVPRDATSSSFFDIERVEVLPGPQGTLYGGDAAGGVINISTKRPGNDYDGEGSIEGGNYGMAHVSLAQDFGFSESFRMRGALDYERHDGYESMNLDSDDKLAGRVSMLWLPTDDITAFLWGSAFHDGGLTAATVNSPYLHLDNPWYVPAVGPLAHNPVDGNLANKGYANYFFGGRVDWNLGAVSLSYLPGYGVISNDSLFYAADFPLTVDAHQHEVTQELRLSDHGNEFLHWLLGFYYQSENKSYVATFNGPVNIDIPYQHDRDYAAFGQVTYDATSWLRVTAGGRYSRDTRSAEGLGNGVPFDADISGSRVDWKVGFDADVSSTSLLYAAIQTGYLPATYSPVPNAADFNNKVQPETLTSYTAGSKNRFLDNSLEVNDEIYYYDYRDYQVVAFNVDIGETSVLNAPKSVIYGNQLSITYVITPQDRVNLGAGYLSAHYTNFTLADVGSYNGFQMAEAPTATVQVGGSHAFYMPGDASLTASFHTDFQSAHWGQFDHQAGTYQPGASKTTLTLEYQPAGAKWSAGLWVHNLENSAVMGATATGGQPGPASVFLDPPRTYGARLSMKW